MTITPLDLQQPARGPGALRRSPVETLRWLTFAILWVFVATIPSASMVIVSDGAGTASRLVGLLAVPVAAAALAMGGRRRRWLDVHLLMVAFVAWACLSWFWTLDTAATAERVGTLAQLVVLLVLIWEFGSDRERWRALLWAYVAGCAFASIQLLQALAVGAELDRGRYSTGGFNPNDLVQVLVLGIPICGYLGISARTGLQRAAAWATLPILTVAIVLTGSRQGIVLLPVALAIVPLAMPQLSRRGRYASLAALAILGVVLLGQVPDATLDRLRSTPTELVGGELGGRGELWTTAIETAQDRPLAGVGEGALESVIAREVGYPAGAHNTYLSVAGELGLVGLGWFLLGLTAAFVHTGRYPPAERLLARTVTAVLVLSLLPGHNEHDKATWLALAVIVAPAAAGWTTSTVRERVRNRIGPAAAGPVPSTRTGGPPWRVG